MHRCAIDPQGHVLGPPAQGQARPDLTGLAGLPVGFPVGLPVGLPGGLPSGRAGEPQPQAAALAAPGPNDQAALNPVRPMARAPGMVQGGGDAAIGMGGHPERLQVESGLQGRGGRIGQRD